MADKKISQFPTFDGTADSEVFFVVGSGEADNPNASNYRYPFNNLTTDITKEGSAWTTGTDLIYTLTGAVGLGTSAPIYQLDVANTGRFRSDLIVSGDMYVSGTTHINKIIDASITGTISGVTGEFADGIFADSLTISGTPVSTGGSIEVPGGGGSVIGGDVSNINFGGTEASDTRAVNFQVGGVDKLVIGSDGDVGIAEDLTVSGSAYVSGNLDVDGFVRANDFGFRGDDIGYYYFDDFGGSNYIGQGPTNPYISLYQNAKQTMVWKDGNVGIGTTTPQGPLHVSNVAANTLSLTREIDILGIANGASSKIEGGALAGVSVSMAAALGFTLEDVDGTDPGVNTKGSLYFETKEGGASLTEKMRIDDTGNVGIGTYPALAGTLVARLHVTGGDGRILAPSGDFSESLTISGQSVLTGSVGGGGIGNVSSASNTVNYLSKWSAANTLVNSSIFDNGNVGIGTPLPQAPLDIVGPDGPLSTANDGIVIRAAATNDWLTMGTDSSTRTSWIRAVRSTVGENDLSLQGDGGNVGIGTTAPKGPLEVLSGAAGHVDELFLTNNNGADDDSAGIVFSQAPATHHYAGIRGIFTDVTAETEDAELAFYTSDAGTYAEKVRIDNNGNVGIGATNPGSMAKLHILGTSQQTDPASSALGNFELLIENDDTTVDNFAKLHLRAGTSDSFILGRNKGTNASELAFYTDENPVGSVERMVITSGGNVGIGTTTPAARLHVTGGKILAPSGDFSESLTISGVPVSTGNGDEEPAFSSDARLKDDVYTLSDSSDKIKQIRGVGFMWNENSSDGLRGREDVGVIAQEVQQILPSAVEEGSDGYLKVKYHRLIPLLLESVKDLQAENKILKERMDSAGL